MVSHEERRLERINMIKRSVDQAHAQGQEINIEKLIAMCSLEWGATRRTILDYLKVLGLR